MFKRPKRRDFNLASQNTTKVNRKLPLEERIKFVSLSSVKHGKGKKRQLILIILLIAIIMIILYIGMPGSFQVKEIKIDEDKVESLK